MPSATKFANLSADERKRLYGIGPRQEEIVPPKPWTNWAKYPACPVCKVKEGESCVDDLREAKSKPHKARETYIETEVEQALVKLLTDQTFLVTLLVGEPISTRLPHWEFTELLEERRIEAEDKLGVVNRRLTR